MKAIWNGATLAESDKTVVIEGNHYFPEDSINKEFFRASETHTACGWKGTASYYDVVAGAKRTKTRLGFTRRRKRKLKRLKITSRFGKALKLLRENV
jgi:uncharacterized protein (DUF427 family)